MVEHIKIGNINPRVQYVGDGIETSFIYPFPIFDEADLGAYLDGTPETAAVDFTTTGVGSDTGGTVEFLSAPAVGAIVTLVRNMTVKRTTDFQESGEFRASVINDELDKIIAMLQESADAKARALHQSATDADGDMELPDRDTRKGFVLAFDPSSGDPVVSTVTTSDIEDGATDAASSAVSAAESASASAISQLAAAASVVTAAATATSLTGTGSITSLLVEVATKAFTVVTGLGFIAGDWVLITSDANPGTNYFHGTVSSYSGTTLNVNVDNIGGSGTHADWTIRRSGVQGTTGASGPTGPAGAGDLTSTLNLSDLDNGATGFDNIKQAATTTFTGVVEVATQAEADVGADTSRVITPSTLAGYAGLGTSNGEFRDVQMFTSSGTWTKPGELVRAEFTVVGGGGGGGGTGGTGGSERSSASGGGAGGCAIELIEAGSLGATETITVGAAGAAAAAGGNGGNGGTSSAGALCSATGGIGGVKVSGGTGRAQDVGGVGGVGSGGDLNLGGCQGGTGNHSSTDGTSGCGGASYFGAGGAAVEAAAAIAGISYGSGGGGANNPSGTSTRVGSAGAAGVVIVKEYF